MINHQLRLNNLNRAKSPEWYVQYSDFPFSAPYKPLTVRNHSKPTQSFDFNMSKNIKTIPTAEYDAVVEVVTKYVDGLRVGDSKKVGQAFHPEAIMYGLHGSNLLGGHIKNLYDFVDQHGASSEIKVRLDVLDITPTTAVVRVDMEKDAMGADYTDFHTLIKLDGKWQIVGKVFHLYAN